METQQDFLRALAEHGAVGRAATSVARTASSAYRLRGRPDAQAFRDGWKAALAHCMAGLREIAINRAMNGHLMPVMRGDVEVGTKLVYNDRLLMFLLRHYDLPGFNAMSPAQRDIDVAAAALATTIAALSELPGETFVPDAYVEGESQTGSFR